MWKEKKRIGHYVVYEEGEKQITVYKPQKAKKTRRIKKLFTKER